MESESADWIKEKASYAKFTARSLHELASIHLSATEASVTRSMTRDELIAYFDTFVKGRINAKSRADAMMREYEYRRKSRVAKCSAKQFRMSDIVTWLVHSGIGGCEVTRCFGIVQRVAQSGYCIVIKLGMEILQLEVSSSDMYYTLDWSNIEEKGIQVSATILEQYDVCKSYAVCMPTKKAKICDEESQTVNPCPPTPTLENG